MKASWPPAMSWVQVKLKLPVQSGVFWMSRAPDRSTKQPAGLGGLGGLAAQAWPLPGAPGTKARNSSYWPWM